MLAVVGLETRAAGTDRDLMPVASRRHSPTPGRLRPQAVLLLALLSGPALLLLPSHSSAAPLSNLIISEVMVNPGGFWGNDDDGLEWVEIFNGTGQAVDLANYTLGWGGADYTFGTLALMDIIAPGQFFVIGGPDNDMTGAPDFDPDLQNGDFWRADGIALFDTRVSTTIPLDALLYSWPGGTNSSGLIDETGAPGSVDVESFASDVSFEYDGIGWVVQNNPTPRKGHPNTPEPSPALSIALGLALLSILRRQPKATWLRDSA